MRTIKNKQGNDVLKLFEQFRKNLKLNVSHDDMPDTEKTTKLKKIKKDIYDGLI